MNGKGDKWRGGWNQNYANNFEKIFGRSKMERTDEWRIEQFNRNRAPEDHVKTIKEMELKIKEIFDEDK